jgi:hypothetical protein
MSLAASPSAQCLGHAVAEALLAGIPAPARRRRRRSRPALRRPLAPVASGVERHVTAIFSELGLTATPETHRRVLAVLTSLRA